MAECSFTSRERERIDAIAFELNGVIEEFFEDAKSDLSAMEWDLLASYAMASVRRVLEIGPLLHAIVDKQCSAAIPYPGRGRDTFVKESLAVWRDSFTPVADVWRLAPIFDKVEGGENRVLADVSALEVMAANRMFSSLDEQCAALLPPE